MRPRFTLWSNHGILVPKRRTGGSRFLGPIAACLVCAIGAGGVYSQIVAERGTVTTTGAGHAEQPTPDSPRQSSETQGTAVDAYARAGATSSESASKPETEPRRIDVDVRRGLASPGSGGDHSATPGRAQQTATGKTMAAKGSAAKGSAAKSAAAKTATQELAELKSEPADAAEANAAEGNADLGKSTARGNATGKVDQKSRATRAPARSGSNVQVYLTPDGREISVRRPVRGDGYAAFEPWDRIERSSRRVPAHAWSFDWF
jgi:hypothetical protein